MASGSAINPNFTTQGARPLPVLFGYGLVSGDPMIPFTLANDTQMSYVALADGECDGIEQYALTATDMLYSSNIKSPPLVNTEILSLLHLGSSVLFHAGQWTPIGIPQKPISTGPDQGYDCNFGNIPSVTPPQSFSNISYVSVWLPDTTAIIGTRIQLQGPGTLQFFGIMRGARCRYFDINGNVTGYGFTTNPTWHMVEVLLRYKFKRQQPQIAGLTAAEKACFNWPAIVAHATVNDGGALRITKSTGGTTDALAPQQKRGFAYALQSTGPTSIAPGNVVTIFYNDATLPPPYDPDLVAAYAAGPVYLSVVMKNAEAGFVTPATVLVTGIGEATPPRYSSRPFYYFTYTVTGPPLSLESTGQGGYGVTYQRVQPPLVTAPLGPPLYAGNYAFASNATLASMLETMLRCCQSYIDDQDGQIAFYHFAAVDSTFALTQNHIDPGSFRCAKKNLMNAPNVFIPNFRDLNIQALVPVASVTVSNAGLTDGFDTINPPTWGAMFDTGGQNPFAQNNIIHYGDGSDPALNHDFVVTFNPPPATTNPAPKVFCFCPGDIQTAVTATGGYLGTQTSRFGKRSPNTVQHSRHQKATGSTAIGIPPLPNVKPVNYDFGNMTYDQANRLVQYLMNSTLGNDVPGWKAPLIGSVKVRLDAVDANGNAFVRMRPNQRFTIDDSVSAEFAGDYLVDPDTGGITIIPPSKSEPLGAIQVNFKSYNSAAYPIASYPPDASLQTIASAALKYWGSSLSMNFVSWTIQATPAVTTAGDGTLTVSAPDLTLQLMGVAGFTAVAGAVWTEIPATGAACLFYQPAGSPGPVHIGAPFFVIPGTAPEIQAAGTYPNNAYFVMSWGSPVSGFVPPFEGF